MLSHRLNINNNFENLLHDLGLFVHVRLVVFNPFFIITTLKFQDHSYKNTSRYLLMIHSYVSKKHKSKWHQINIKKRSVINMLAASDYVPI